MSDLLLDGLKPSDLHLQDDRWPEFRDEQLEFIEMATFSPKRFFVAMMPPGTGKTLAALSLARYMDRRTVICTATKGLQDQYMDLHGQHGLVDLRGRRNYDCGLFGDCDLGSKLGCKDCLTERVGYGQAKRIARNSQEIVTNYDLWMSVNDRAKGLKRRQDEAEELGENPVQLLICDEAHHAKDKIADYMGCKVVEGEIEKYLETINLGDKLEEWKTVASRVMPEIESEIELLKYQLKVKPDSKVVKLLDRKEELASKLGRILAADEGEWVIEKHEGTRWGRTWSFDIVWPGKYAERYLFCGVPKVVLMSGTIRPKEMALLGVPQSEYEFVEWPFPFPPQNHPIYHLPPVKINKKGEQVAVNINHKITDDDLALWVGVIDDIVGEFLQERVVIHTVSYERQKYLMAHSRFGKFMVGNSNNPNDPLEERLASKVFEDFITTKPPVILVSPSFGEGWDFKDDRCRLNIIAKVPYSPMHSKVMVARRERDPQYGDYLAVIDLIQSIRRPQRSETDTAVTYITDGALMSLLGRNKGLVPRELQYGKGIRRVNSVQKNSNK